MHKGTVKRVHISRLNQLFTSDLVFSSAIYLVVVDALASGTNTIK